MITHNANIYAALFLLNLMISACVTAPVNAETILQVDTAAIPRDQPDDMETQARAAALAKGTAANLATGAGSVIKEKAVKLASDFKEGADQSLPGKVASEIRGGGADNSVQFDGNSLTGTELNDEVATFVNKSQGAV